MCGRIKGAACAIILNGQVVIALLRSDVWHSHSHSGTVEQIGLWLTDCEDNIENLRDDLLHLVR